LIRKNIEFNDPQVVDFKIKESKIPLTLSDDEVNIDSDEENLPEDLEKRDSSPVSPKFNARQPSVPLHMQLRDRKVRFN